MSLPARPTEFSDETLAQRLQTGDRSAAATLIERHHNALIGYLYRLARDDRPLAEDLAQETFIRLIRGIARYEYPRPFKPYLYQIATNLARDHFKSAGTRRVSPLEDGEWCDPDSDPETALSSALEARQAAALLAELPNLQREAILLRYFQELSLAEMAAVLGVPVGTVKSRLSLGLKRLRGLLDPQSLHEQEA